MCCVITLLLVIGPRVAAIAWYLIDPGRWSATFSTLLIPVLGVLFLPWTTLAWVLTAPGGINGLDWLWLALAVLIDLGSYGGGGYGNRGRWRRG